jgi:hypothetical protein
MHDDAFEWDDAKAEGNYRKHGVDFETATEAFADPFAIERVESFAARDGEERFSHHRHGDRPSSDGRLHDTPREDSSHFSPSSNQARA